MYKLDQAEPRLRLPYRWYLYGAVMDDAEVKGIIEFDHPDDELSTNVRVLVPEPQLPRDLLDAGEKIKEISADFARTYSGEGYYNPMLEDHYKSAPLDFQKAFLNWSMEVEGMMRNEPAYRGPALRLLEIKLHELEKTYIKDGLQVEPRLRDIFFQIMLADRCLLKKAEGPDFGQTMSRINSLTFDFWTVFVKFLSLGHHGRISPHRLGSYQSKAERDIIQYKNRIPRELDDIFRTCPRDPAVSEPLLDNLSGTAISEYLSWKDD